VSLVFCAGIEMPVKVFAERKVLTQSRPHETHQWQGNGMASRTTSRSVLAAIAGLVALALVAGTATAAHADAFRHDDATGDVIVTVPGSPGTSHVDPSQTTPDLQNLTVLHGRWIVSVATALRGLEGNGTSTWVATIVTSKGDRFDVYRGARYFDPSVRMKRNGTLFTCDGLYVHRTSVGVIAKVPTRCLGTPWKVRVGVLARTDYGSEKRPPQGHDDVLRNGVVSYGNPALSSWIAR